jgi:phosphohistidine phosphatase SixA
VQRQAALTVRRLILLRHADSESSAQLRDYDRPISQQGRREAAAVAKQLCDLGWVPDLIIASNSRRTKQTLDTMAEAAAELSHVRAGGLRVPGACVACVRAPRWCARGGCSRAWMWTGAVHLHPRV